MNKGILFGVILALCSSSALAASNNGGFNGAMGGGFNGPTLTSVTVEEAKQMKDDARVVLRGNIIQSLGDEEYLFKDNSGTITIEIDDKRWNGLTVTPADLVEIRGEVDRGWKSVEIEVKKIMKIEK